VHEKRLEIINGVAQQIALAIQNEKLNLEMVGRERMEREFQLAREIQKTFLPDHLPVTPGYMLDIRWETAREVGGDFYDLFLIDPDHLGIVVADVADKGMPAALYMTVTRTLIRANVHPHRSPSRVLERVNDLLIGDSQNGMFVTAALAILDLRTGIVAYANAGHNLPVLIESNGEAATLPKGGIALAVQEGAKYTDHTISLKPGDALLFYTDGVTESFSPSEEAFGEKRLMQLLSTPGLEDPCQLLGMVETALSDFRQGKDLSDDLTLVGLFRNPEIQPE
jgi:serine phosphatase RsbU (regulator of sigma subunit)